MKIHHPVHTFISSFSLSLSACTNVLIDSPNNNNNNINYSVPSFLLTKHNTRWGQERGRCEESSTSQSFSPRNLTYHSIYLLAALSTPKKTTTATQLGSERRDANRDWWWRRGGRRRRKSNFFVEKHLPWLDGSILLIFNSLRRFI